MVADCSAGLLRNSFGCGAADWFIGQGLEGGIAKISADDDKFGPRAASLL